MKFSLRILLAASATCFVSSVLAADVVPNHIRHPLHASTVKVLAPKSVVRMGVAATASSAGSYVPLYANGGLSNTNTIAGLSWAALLGDTATYADNSVQQADVGSTVAGLDSSGNVTAPVVGDMSAAKATATGSTFSRSLSTRAVDTINVKDFGAVCDGVTDDYTAIQAALTYAQENTGSNIRILVPFGSCYSSNGVIYKSTNRQGFVISGAGIAASTLKFASGGLTLTTEGGSVDVSYLHIQRTASSQGDTGLLVSSPVSAASSNISNVKIDGNTRSGSFLHGATFSGIGPNIVNLTTILPDDATSGDTSTSTGLDISGVVNGTTTIWAIDTKIVNSVFQGGHYGVNVHGPVQGVFITNSEALGGEVGFNWNDTDPSTDFPELLLINNFHSNSYIYGVYTNNVNQISIYGGLFLHFDAGTDTYMSVSLNNGSNATVSGTITNGSNPTGGSETGISLANFSVGNVYGNQNEGVEGPVVSVTGTSSYVSVTGNVGAYYPSYTGDKIVGCGNNVLCAGNNIDNRLVGISVDSSGDVSVTGSEGAGYGNFNVNNSAAFMPPTYVTSASGYGFNIDGFLYNALTSTDASNITLCPSEACNIGYSGGQVNISGNLSTNSITAREPVTVTGSITGTDLIATDATTPTSSTACKQGEMHSDDNYLYVCTSGLTYKKVALSDLN